MNFRFNNISEGKTGQTESSGDPPPLFDSTTNSRLAPSLLLWIIIAFVFGFFIWAYFTELDRTVRGQGRIASDSQMQLVSNLEGGIVDEILVSVGADVKKGDPLVRLDEIRLGSEYNSNKEQFDALKIKIARLQSEINGTQPKFPNNAGSLDNEQIAIEQTLYTSRMADLRSLTSGASARIRQANQSVAEAQANFRARQAAQRAAQNEVRILQPLVDRGIEPRLSLIQARSRANVASAEVSAAAASVGRTQATVAEAQAALGQLRQDWRSRAADELASIQAQYASLSRSLPALEDRVRRTVIRAPLSGRVNRLLASTVGGTVQPGDPIVEIVPSNEQLVVEALIKPADIGQVRIDQEAKVNISAYQSIVYGSLNGRVINISPDTTTDQRTGETSYTVRIITDGELLDGEGKPVKIGTGMTADVSLLGEKQSILDYILTPITRLGRSALRE